MTKIWHGYPHFFLFPLISLPGILLSSNLNLSFIIFLVEMHHHTLNWKKNYTYIYCWDWITLLMRNLEKILDISKESLFIVTLHVYCSKYCSCIQSHMRAHFGPHGSLNMLCNLLWELTLARTTFWLSYTTLYTGVFWST